ncbi:MAG TPA: hypothetical protein VHI13_16800 [Candidatus Kapabacteria bacterium]|nr:hypothetical protein [Candidatus Kapabacteria bacterium]
MALLRTFDGNAQGIVQDSTIRNTFLAKFFAACPVLDFLHFYQFPGSADEPLKDADARAGRTRAINDAWPNNRTTPQWGSISLKVFGDKVETDQEWQVRLAGYGGIAAEHMRQLEEAGSSMGRYFMELFMTSDGTGTLFPGLPTLHVPIDGVTDVVLGADGTALSLEDTTTAKKNNRLVKEKVDWLARNSDVLVMAELVRDRLTTLATDRVTTQSVQNAVGEEVILTKWAGKPIILSGNTKDDDAPIQDLNEVVGDSEDCTSIWGFKTGERQHLTAGTNVGFRVEAPKMVDNMLTTNMNLSIGLTLLKDRSLRRIRGIRVPQT